MYDVRLIFRNRAGVKIGDMSAAGGSNVGLIEVDAFVREDGIGSLSYTLCDSDISTQLDCEYQVELWARKSKGAQPWRVVGCFFHMDEECTEFGKPGQYKVEGEAVDVMAMLKWRTLAWTEDSADCMTFDDVPIETIGKILVEKNAGAGATVAAGRLGKDGTIPKLSIEGDFGRGATVTRNYSKGTSLYTALQELAAIDDSSWKIEKTTTPTGPTCWELVFCPADDPDRASDAVFSSSLNNINGAKLINRRSRARNCAIVDNDDGIVAAVSANDYDPTKINCEMYVQSTDEDTVEGLEGRGLTALNDPRVRPQELFSFEAVNKRFCWLEDYDVGDNVRASFKGRDETRRVYAVRLRGGNGKPMLARPYTRVLYA